MNIMSKEVLEPSGFFPPNPSSLCIILTTGLKQFLIGIFLITRYIIWACSSCKIWYFVMLDPRPNPNPGLI